MWHAFQTTIWIMGCSQSPYSPNLVRLRRLRVAILTTICLLAFSLLVKTHANIVTGCTKVMIQISLWHLEASDVHITIQNLMQSSENHVEFKIIMSITVKSSTDVPYFRVIVWFWPNMSRNCSTLEHIKKHRIQTRWMTRQWSISSFGLFWLCRKFVSLWTSKWGEILDKLGSKSLRFERAL